MARPGLRNHPKFRRMVHELKMPAIYVQAHLQAMWDVGYECGNARLGDDMDVELAAEWDLSGRSPGEFFKAARDFLDVENGIYFIHDLFDHAPEYVKKRAKREDQRKNKDLNQKTADNGRQRRKVADNGHPPAPAPAPAPSFVSEDTSDATASQDRADPPPVDEKPQRNIGGSRPGAGRKAATNPNTIPAHDYFRARWKSKYGEDDPSDFGRDRASVKWMLRQVKDDLLRLQKIFDAFLDDSCAWYVDKRHSITVLKNDFRRFLVPEKPADSGWFRDLPRATVTPDLEQFLISSGEKK